MEAPTRLRRVDDSLLNFSWFFSADTITIQTIRLPSWPIRCLSVIQTPDFKPALSTAQSTPRSTFRLVSSQEDPQRRVCASSLSHLKNDQRLHHAHPS